MIREMSRMAELTGHPADAAEYRDLAAAIKQSFNDAFFNDTLGRYTANGDAGALAAGNRDDVLWELLQENDQPSYGYFMESTPANPGGMTTIGERWTRGDSKNHMILAQIDEWFQAGLGGIRPATNAYGTLVVQPKPVGDLRYVRSSYETPQGTARSSWTRTDDRFTLTVTIPANTTAQVWVPAGRGDVTAPRANFERVDGRYSVYTVPSGQFTFVAT
jgi:alpha-L-rhamnosidase